MNPGLAAVTGATGFLGRQVVRALHAEGWRVRILARRDPAHPLWDGLDNDVQRGDLSDEDGLRRLCRGADVVLHLAGLVKAPDRKAFDAVNADGAERMARAAATAAPGARFVLISSLVARAPHLSDYAASKRAGEQAVERVAGGAALVVRPPALYGPADAETLALFRAAARSPVLPVLSPEARIALLHAEDAARQIVALASSDVRGRPIALSDGRPQGYGLGEIMLAAGAAVGTRPRLAPVPDFAWRALGLGGDLCRGLGAATILSSGKMRELLHRDWSVPVRERWRDLPPARFDLAGGFAQTAAWYRADGALPPRLFLTQSWRARLTRGMGA